MSKRNKDQVFLEIAHTLGELSTCDRAHIGAVVTHEGRCVAWGYNGAPPGLPHCDENWHGWAESGTWKDRDLREFGCKNASHAEANAISFAARQGISTDNGTLYVSQSPCLTCSRLIIAAGIKRVVYGTMYRDQAGVKLLRAAGIPCIIVH